MDIGVCVGVLTTRILAARSPTIPLHTFIGLLVSFFQLLSLVLMPSGLGKDVKNWMLLLGFPFMHLSVRATNAFSTYLVPWAALEPYVCTNCKLLFLWTFLLSCTALFLTFSSFNKVTSFHRLSLFNSICMPDAPFAVSALFCQWSSGASYWNATFSFATSMQWTVFSLIAPAVFLANSYHSAFYTFNEYKENFFNWGFLIKGELVAVIYFEHFATVWFTETPGLRIVLLVLILYAFKKLQEVYWPYTLREANIVAEDCYWSAILAVLWRWFQRQWLLYAALLLPCRHLLLLRSLLPSKLKP